MRKLMTPKETIAAIKTMLGFSTDEPAPVPTPVEGTTYKLADGTEVLIDKLEIGGKVLIGDQAAPDGVHNLEDGTAVTVAEGVITEVKKAEGDPAPDPLETPEQMRAALEQFIEATIEQKLTAALSKSKEVFTKQEQIIANQKEAITKLTELVEQIADQPADGKVEDTPEWENMTPLQRFRANKQTSQN